MKNHMKTKLKNIVKLTAVVALAAAIVLTFSACGEGDNSDGEGQDEPGAYKELAVGDEAPDFEAELAGGGTFKLSDADGKVVLLNFWATWCGPCCEEMPAFERLYKEYDADEVQILAVNVAEPKSDLDRFIEDNGYTFPIAYDEEGIITADLYPTEGIPYTVVIGKDGTITETFVGASSADAQYKIYKKAIDEALAK